MRGMGSAHCALASLHHQRALAWGCRGVEDLDGDEMSPRLQEDLVLHLPGAVRPGHHVAQRAARPVGHEDGVVLRHRLRVTHADLDAEDAPGRRYGYDASLRVGELDASDLRQ